MTLLGAAPPEKPSKGFDRPFDVRRWSDNPELENCLNILVAQIEAVEKTRTKKRSVGVAKRFRAAISALALDLYVAWKCDPLGEVAVALGKEAYKAGSRYAKLYFTYDTFKPAFDGLKRLGYLEIVRKGFNDPRTGIGRVTRVRATPKLIERLKGLPLAAIALDPSIETIVLRDAQDKVDIDYEDTDFTRAARANLQRINAKLASHWIDLNLSDLEFASLTEQMQRRHLADKEAKKNKQRAASVDFTARTLRRIFNNESWQQGGRFYGGWWQSIPKGYRRFITIDGKQTVELDYSGLHAVMLYADENAEPPTDSYDPGFVGAPLASRELVKRTFMKLLNAPGRIDPNDFVDSEVGMSWSEFQKRIIEAHPLIRHRFRTGYGLELQNRDAQIAERVMLRFSSMDYPCLPVHDSFLVHHALASELDDIMQEEFRATTGRSCPVKQKEPSEEAIGSGLLSASIGELLENDGPFAGYEKRWQDWLILTKDRKHKAIETPSRI